MRKSPQGNDQPAIQAKKSLIQQSESLGLVLSGGGSRAAYQIGALRALIPYLQKTGSPFSIYVGSSIGAINSLLFAAASRQGIQFAVDQLTDLWEERTFSNTFSGSPSRSFLKAIKIATVQYMAPGPNPTDDSIFNPSPLMKRVDDSIDHYGGLTPDARDPNISGVAVITTLEGPERKPLLFVSTHKQISEENLKGATFEICYRDHLSAKHGFASAALPSVLPPVKLDTEHGNVKLVDGGISQNVPIDPALRLGAQKIIAIDISGRLWWHDRYGEAHDTRPKWEVLAKDDTFCLVPPELFMIRANNSLGKILKEALGRSTAARIKTLGPVWPIFKLLEKKLGEEVAYETMSYIALSKDYILGLIEAGYRDTEKLFKDKSKIEFKRETEIK